MKKTARFRKLATLLIAVPTLSMIALGWGAYLTLQRLETAHQAVTQTIQVGDAANRLLKNFIDQETGIRGYLLEQDQKFLEPYIAARQSVAQIFTELSWLTKGEPEQQRNIALIASTYEQWEGQTTIALSRGGLSINRSPYDIEGKRLMDKLRYQIQTVIATERQSRILRTTAASNIQLIAYSALAFITFLGIVTGSLVLRIWQKLTHGFAEKINELERSAIHDKLTGLPNREYLDRQLPVMLEKARSCGENLGLIHFDLDRFKQVNDDFGHAVGDRILKVTAERVKDTLRDGSLLTRTGDDEFTAVLSDIHLAAIPSIAAAILSNASRPIVLEHLQVPVSISAGAAISDGLDAHLFRRNATQALRVSKRNGGNAFRVFDTNLSKAEERDARILKGIEAALTSSDGLYLAYQPIFTPDRRLHGLEALLRLRLPGDGLISPAEFIPLAEQSGLIVVLGSWVLRNVCNQINEWSSKWPTVPLISINVSPIQFVQPTFAQDVSTVFLAAGLNPKRIILELTETAVMSNFVLARDQMATLHDYGFRIAVDDFGTGYSSLSYLHELEIDSLKIDRSFIAKMMVSGGSLAVVRAIIGLAQALEMQIVAEGVETHEQLEALREMHCDYIQGYVFARPMISSDVDALLTPGIPLNGSGQPYSSDAIDSVTGSKGGDDHRTPSD